MGRLLDSGARATRLAGGHVDSSVSVFFSAGGVIWLCVGRSDRLALWLMKRRRRTSPATENPRRRKRARRTWRTVHGERGDIKNRREDVCASWDAYETAGILIVKVPSN